MVNERWLPVRSDHWSETDIRLSGLDVDVPNSARIYDWLLGGGLNFDVDRRLARRLVAAFPALPAMARHSRAWLRRAVCALVEEYGVDQFLDLGSGLPSMGYTHEVARSINPAARVVYVDNDGIAVAHSQYVTEGLDGVTAVEADFTRPAEVLAHPDTQATLDLDRPVAVIFSCALHLITDDADPWRVTAAYRDTLPAGGFLAISHASLESVSDQGLVDQLLKGGSHPFVPRSHAAVLAMFDGYRLLPPGLVFATQWRPDFDLPEFPPAEDHSGCHVAIGRR